MTNRLSSLFFCFVLFCCSAQMLLAEEQRMGWTTDFEYNAKSLPSIEVKLSPPENPLPQVSAEIKKLEASRLKLEESLMEKLEDEYNKALTSSKLRIKETVEKTLSIFDNPNMLRSIISESVKPLKRDHIRRVKEVSQEESSENLERSFDESSGPLPPPEVRDHTSFIEQNYLKGATPSVRITLSELTEPDVAIKDKIEEIEQYRSDEEVMMFESAISEMNSLREITILELEKQIQLQLNPFLVNKMIVHRTLENELKELEKREETNHMRENAQKQSSFLEQNSSDEDTGNILNVKISQTDSNYPTVDELVMNMQKRRDLTERLERQKILDLQMKLLKVQSEMIKDALHFSISKIIAQYSPIVETMKIEAMRMM